MSRREALGLGITDQGERAYSAGWQWRRRGHQLPPPPAAATQWWGDFAAGWEDQDFELELEMR